MLGNWAVRGCLFICSLGFGLTARGFVGVAAPHMVGVECDGPLSENCILKSENSSIEMSVDDDQALVAQLGSESVSIENDLAERVAAGELTSDQSAAIAGELSRLEGMSYQVPSVDVLKSDLGFPKESEIEEIDLVDLVRAHLQVVFGMSALSAAYLTDRLGVQALPENSVR